jgi:hypothetical protein
LNPSPSKHDAHELPSIISVTIKLYTVVKIADLTRQFGDAGLGLAPHGPIQSDWFGASYANLKQPHIL